MNKKGKIIISIIILLVSIAISTIVLASKDDYLSEKENDPSPIYSGEKKFYIKKNSSGYVDKSDFYSAVNLTKYATNNPKNFIGTPAQWVVGRQMTNQSTDSGTVVGSGNTWYWTHCIDPKHDGRLGHYRVLNVIDIDTDDKLQCVVYRAKTGKLGYSKPKVLSGASEDYARQLAYMIYKNKDWHNVGSSTTWSVNVAYLYGNIYQRNKGAFYPTLVYPGPDLSSSSDAHLKQARAYASGVEEDSGYKQISKESKNSDAGVTYKKIGNSSYVVLGPFKANYKGGSASLTKAIVLDNETGTKYTKRNGDICVTNKQGTKDKGSNIKSDNEFYVRVKVNFAEKNLGKKSFNVYVKQTGGTVYSARLMLMSNVNPGYIAQNIAIDAATKKGKSKTIHWKVGADSTGENSLVIKKLGNIYNSDEIKAVPGVTFNVYKDGQLYQTIVTGTDGTYTLTNIPEGYYTAVETAIPADNMDYYFPAQSDEDKTAGPIYVGEDDEKTLEMTAVNEQYSNFKIFKHVKGAQTPIAGVTFKVQFYDKNYERWRWLNKYEYSGAGPADIDTCDDESQAKAFITPADGTIYLSNIPCGEYRVKEVSIPEDLPYGYDPEWNADGIEHMSPTILCGPICASNAADYTYRTFDCKNPWFIKISGYVYSPEKGGKDEKSVLNGRSGKYSSATDYKVANASVTLMKKDANGNYQNYEIKPQEGEAGTPVTDANGYYEYTVIITKEEEANDFRVKFEYDGIDFVAMTPDYVDEAYPKEELTDGSSSKAKEDEEKRKKLNEGYSEIKGTTDAQLEAGKANKLNIEAEEDLTYKFSKQEFTDEEVEKRSQESEQFKNKGTTTGTSISEIQNYKTGYQEDKDSKVRTINSNRIEKNTIDAIYNLSGEGTTDNKYNYDNYDIRTEATSTNPNVLKKVIQLNLGIIKREQPDLSLKNKIVGVNATINGYTNLYKATATRKPAENSINVGVTYVNEGQLARFPVYPSDVKTISDNKKDELQLFITYQIDIINNSHTLYSKANELAIFYDMGYEYKRASTSLSDDNTADKNNAIEEIDSENARRKVGLTENGNPYQVKFLNTSKLGRIKPLDDPNGNQIPIYVTYQVKPDELIKMIGQENYIPQYRNIVEIDSYSTYSEDNDTSLYAGIDQNSAPGNVPTEISTEARERKYVRSLFDDDTGYAEEFTLYLKDDRSLKGKVFFDESENGKNVRKGTERKSNGKYDSSDGDFPMQKVKVTLVEVKVDSNNKVQYDENTGKVIEREEKQQEDLTVEVDENGEYIISKFIPGNYMLKYEYDDQSYYTDLNNQKNNINAVDFKSAIITEENKKYGELNYDYTANSDVTKWYLRDNPKWYAYNKDGNGDVKESGHDNTEYTKYTEAIDNWKTRNQLDYEDFNYKNTDQELSKAGTMDAYTPVFAICVELNTLVDDNKYLPQGYNIDNMDFGITRRAHQEIEIEKRISNIKITLPNGQVLLDGDPKENKKMSGLKYLAPTDNTNGTVNIELDSELIHGSVLEITHEIKVHNLGEKDYYNKQYYTYGNSKENEVTITPQVYDYVDNNLTFDYEANKEQWEVISSNKFGEDKEIVISNNVTESINKFNTIVHYKGEQLKEIKAGESKNINLILTRVLSNSDDEDLTYNNNIEIVHGTKNHKGRRLWVRVGEYLDTANSSGIGDTSEETTITPPTGEDKDYTIYIVAGLVSLLILASGIIIIKKKVLK